MSLLLLFGGGAPPAPVYFTGYLDLKFPKKFNIYHSTAAINYAGAPQAIVEDDGREEFKRLSVALPPGSYFHNVVAVDDEGDKETGLADLGPVEVNALPAAPVITGVTQLSPFNFRAAFSADAGASSHTLYRSHVNSPINFGDLAGGPAPIAATTPTEDFTVAAFTPQDDEPAFDDVADGFETAVYAASLEFDGSASFTDFEADFVTLTETIEGLVDTFAEDVFLPLFAIKESLIISGEQTLNNLGSIPDANWSTFAQDHYGTYLQKLGLLLSDEPQRFVLLNGDVSGIESLTETNRSLFDVVQPFVKRNLVNLIIRSTLAGEEERNDIAYEIELDDSGNLIFPRPSRAFLVQYTLSTSGVTKSIVVRAGVVDDDFEPAGFLDIYIYTGAINLASPTQSIALGEAVVGHKEGTFTAETLTADTWYKLSVVARTAAGERGEFNPETDYEDIYSGVDTPITAGNITAHVVRGG